MKNLTYDNLMERLKDLFDDIHEMDELEATEFIVRVLRLRDKMKRGE